MLRSDVTPAGRHFCEHRHSRKALRGLGSDDERRLDRVLRGTAGLLPHHRHQEKHQMMLHLMPTSGGENMRTTINIDDELLAKATKLAGQMDRTAMVSEGLKALIERESARRLARLGGTQPKLKAAPRRRQGSPV
jgi:Arc/MetJ family transcription regulator